MEQREILIRLAIEYEGDYNKIYEAIVRKECPSEEDTYNLNCKAVTYFDDEYPEYLKQTFKPPLVLFYYGDISLLKDFEKCIALIGTREPTPYGIEATQRIARSLAKQVVIVSGLARGIDAIGHSEAINSGGKVIAVLGSGIDICYPSDNEELYEIIKKDHLVISEYPPGVTPTPDKFPMRNRIIAAISKATVITEAYRRSGTSITATMALDIGRDVCCVPYPFGEYSFCNHLIQTGAYLIQKPEDIFHVLDIKKETPIFDL